MDTHEVPDPIAYQKMWEEQLNSFKPVEGDLSPDGKASVAGEYSEAENIEYALSTALNVVLDEGDMERAVNSVSLLLAEARRRTLEDVNRKADALLEGQEWNHEAIDFWEELKAKL